MKNHILQEFNLHISNAEDQDTHVFDDTLEAMGLVKHVDFSTDKCGNIFNLVITGVGSKVDIIRCTPGQFRSHHKAVIVKTRL